MKSLASCRVRPRWGHLHHLLISIALFGDMQAEAPAAAYRALSFRRPADDKRDDTIRAAFAAVAGQVPASLYTSVGEANKLALWLLIFLLALPEADENSKVSTQRHVCSMQCVCLAQNATQLSIEKLRSILQVGSDRCPAQADADIALVRGCCPVNMEHNAVSRLKL